MKVYFAYLTLLEERYLKDGNLSSILERSFPVQTNGRFITILYGWTTSKKIMKEFLQIRNVNGKEIYQIRKVNYDDDEAQTFMNDRSLFDYEITMEEYETHSDTWNKHDTIKIPTTGFEYNYITNNISELMSEIVDDVINVPCMMYDEKYLDALDFFNVVDRSLFMYGAGCDDADFWGDDYQSYLDESNNNNSYGLTLKCHKLLINSSVDELELLLTVFSDAFHFNEA